MWKDEKQTEAEMHKGCIVCHSIFLCNLIFNADRPDGRKLIYAGE